MLSRILALVAAVGVASGASAAVLETKLEYKDGEQVLEGWVIRDSSRHGALPGILVVHEWMGITEHTKSQARKLAKLGYVAFVADIFGKGVRPQSREEAQKVSSPFKEDRGLMRKRAQAGLAELYKLKGVDKGRIAAIGYCFGGTTVLELARSGADLDGVVSFHGGLSTPNPSATSLSAAAGRAANPTVPDGPA